FLIALGIAFFLVQIYVSWRDREALRDHTGDPWDGRTLEWSTSSPPPDYNFAFTPRVHERDSWWHMKQVGYRRPEDGFVDIHMPKNTAAGFILAALSTVLGFTLIWHMWAPTIVVFVALVAASIYHTFNYNRDTHVSAADVTRTEQARTLQLARHV